MAEYEVRFQIRVPKSRNPNTGAVKFAPSGYSSTPVKVNAASAAEARKIAARTEKVTKAKASAARGLDYDMPKPRVQITDVSRVSPSRGGGSMGGGSIKTPDEYGNRRNPTGTRRKMNKGGMAKKKK